MSKNLINPFDLLGVTIDSTLRDVRKAYYKLSLVCHPDKGGSKDDMNVVHKAYLYVKKQIEFSDEKDTLENIEDDFKNFFEINKIELPHFYDIWERSEEADFLREFNKQFDENKNGGLSYTNASNIFGNGYGKFMEEEEGKTLRDTTSSLMNRTETQKQLDILEEYRNINTKKDLKTKFSEEIVIYNEPTAVPESYGTYERFDLAELDDYSQKTDSLEMSDYKIAHSEKKERELNEEEKEKIDMNSEEALKRLKEKRDEYNKSLSELYLYPEYEKNKRVVTTKIVYSKVDID